MVKIHALDHVPHCYTAADGAVVATVIRDQLATGHTVTVSLAGVTDAPSSFVNAAFVNLLDSYSYDFIRQHVAIVDSTPQINDLIRRRFKFVLENRVAV